MRNFWTTLIVFAVIILTFFLQFNFFNLVPLFGVKPNLGVILVVALSIMCGQGVGIAVGMTYGILSDVLLGKAFGIYTLLFFLMGYFCGKMSKGFSKENKNTIIMITLASTVVLECATYLLFVWVYHYEIELLVILKTIVLEGIYHMILARICFKMFSGLAEIINKGKRYYYLL